MLVPAETTPLLGRAASLGAVRAWLAEGASLVTVTGPAGVGKTRLANAIAHDAAQADRGFCDLSESSNVDQLCAVVARTLLVPLPTTASLAGAPEHLARVLRTRGALLLVLDNFEQLDRECERSLAAWMAEAPNVTFLVTSRRRLGLPGEHTLELPPLALPRSAEVDAAALRKSPAVRLFVDRASMAGAHIAEADLSIVGDIVRELDGLPLAIELAAAKSPMLSPSEIRRRLADRFALLRDRGLRVDRQVTLRAALDWSWSLLGEAARQALTQCSLFRGGWDVDAASTILAGPDEDVSGLDMLEDLHRQSLLVVERGKDSERRFRLYASVRVYAAEHATNMDSVRDRYAAHYARVAADHAGSLHGPDGEIAYRALVRECDNIMAAVDRLQISDPRLALDTLLAVAPVFERQGPLDALLRALATTLAAADPLDPARLARGLVTKAQGLEASGDVVGAHEALLEANRHAEKSGDDATMVEAAIALGWTAGIRGDYDTADAAFERAASRSESLPNARLQALLLQRRGYLSYRRGRRRSAETDMQAAVAIYRELGARRDEASALGWLGFVGDGSAERAIPYFKRSLKILEELGDERQLARHLQYFAALENDSGRPKAALEHFERALTLQRRSGDRQQEAVTQARRAVVYLELGEPSKALDEVVMALQCLDGESDLLYRGEALAFAAAAQAELGLIGSAQRHLQEAEAILTRLGYPGLDAFRLLAARCTLAAARDGEIPADVAALADAQGVDLSYAFTRLAHRLLLRALRQEQPAQPSLTVADDLRWFEVDGERHDLSRRAPMRRLLAALVNAAESAAPPLSVSELIEAGWPGERVVGSSGESRVYTTVRRLRKMGLEQLIHHDGAGYRLVAAIERR